MFFLYIMYRRTVMVIHHCIYVHTSKYLVQVFPLIPSSFWLQVICKTHYTTEMLETSLRTRLVPVPWCHGDDKAHSILTLITSHVAMMNKQHSYWSVLVLMLTTRMLWGLLLLKWLQLLGTVECWEFLWSILKFNWTHRWTAVLLQLFSISA